MAAAVAGVIARHHDGADAGALRLAEAGGRFGAGWIEHADEAHKHELFLRRLGSKREGHG